MKEEHTLGPWKAIGDKIYSADRRQVAHVYALVHQHDLNVMQSIPNARLIAAAPELLDALKHLHEAAKGRDETKYREAMAKAGRLIQKIENNERP